MSISIRRVTGDDDLEQWTRAVMRVFHRGLANDEMHKMIAWQRRFVDEEDGVTSMALRDDDLAGTFRSFHTEMTVPGGQSVPVQALTGVTVQTQHRRRGVLTAMMQDDLEHARERGEAGAVLFAAEYPIYARFGYGPATDAQSVVVDKLRTELRPEIGEAAANGSIEYVSTDELARVALQVYERARRRHAGSIARSQFKHEIETRALEWPGEPWNGWQVVSRDERGALDGYAIFRTNRTWTDDMPNETLTLEDVCAVDTDAHARLWHFLLSMDLVTKIEAEELPVDDALPLLLTNPRAVRRSLYADGMWLRPVDVVALVGARTLGDGAVDVCVVDEGPIDAGGVFHFEAGSVRRSRRASGDAAMSISTLGSIVLGSARPSVLGSVGRIEVRDDATLRTLDAMFAVDSPPFAATHF